MEDLDEPRAHALGFAAPPFQGCMEDLTEPRAHALGFAVPPFQGYMTVETEAGQCENLGGSMNV
jgi:hypothetical protein